MASDNIAPVLQMKYMLRDAESHPRGIPGFTAPQAIAQLPVGEAVAAVNDADGPSAYLVNILLAAVTCENEAAKGPVITGDFDSAVFFNENRVAASSKIPERILNPHAEVLQTIEGSINPTVDLVSADHYGQDAGPALQEADVGTNTQIAPALQVQHAATQALQAVPDAAATAPQALAPAAGPLRNYDTIHDAMADLDRTRYATRAGQVEGRFTIGGASCVHIELLGDDRCELCRRRDRQCIVAVGLVPVRSRKCAYCIKHNKVCCRPQRNQ